MEAQLAQRQADVQQAQANLERDTAQLDNARVQERRYHELVQRELVAREQYDQFRTALSTMEATVTADRAAIANAKAALLAAQAGVDNAKAVIRADEAMVDNARLQLGYTAIRAPMTGRTGNLLVQAGNVVKSNEDNPLVVIAQVHPIYVSFAVPEQYLAQIKTYQAAGALEVKASAPGVSPAASGRLTFVNNTVDTTTGTIQLKATFQNGDNRLWPGQYVNVAMTLTTENAVVVPAPAVQAGQQGPFVFVVKADLTVENRKVEVGRRLPGETIITRGVSPGERVVTDGQLRLVPGAKIEIRPPKTS
jgi:multidrug efflux system membrane fusion protein